jgi:energy-coupling factor transporter ATP-binding protein EcfA2
MSRLMKKIERNHQHLYGTKVLTAIVTGWVHMGRTIALKLSPTEEQIVRQLNKQGMTNSELLRNALRQYFEFLHQTTGLIAAEKSTSEVHDDAGVVFQDSLRNIINDVEEIRRSLQKTQDEMHQETERIQQTLSELSIDATVNQDNSSLSKIETFKDVHDEIDTFLEHHTKQSDIWKEPF